MDSDRPLDKIFDRRFQNALQTYEEELKKLGKRQEL